MGIKPETRFYSSVHKHLPPEVLFHREKMTNPYRGGTWDHWYDGAQRDLWIEWKFIVLPKRDETPIDLCGGKKPPLSHLQQEWGRGREANGRNVWVGVGCSEGGVLLKSRTLWDLPFSTGWFRQQLMDRKHLANEILTFCQP